MSAEPHPCPSASATATTSTASSPAATFCSAASSSPTRSVPIAHSDGDVVLHALVDASRRDGLGRHRRTFPRHRPAWKDAASRVFVETVYAEVTRGGVSCSGNVDVTILAERPKLKPFKPAMVAATAGDCSGRTACINVKAGTNEGLRRHRPRRSDRRPRGRAARSPASKLVLRRSTVL